MPNALPTFNFRNVHLGWGGVPFLNFAEEGISVSPNNSAFTTTTMSIDGYSNIAAGTDYSGMVNVNLSSKSHTNKYLAALVNDYRYGSGILHTANMVLYDEAGIIPCLIKNAYIQTLPENMTLGETLEGKTFTWGFKCEELIWSYDLDSIPQAIIDQFKEETDNQISIFAQFEF